MVCEYEFDEESKTITVNCMGCVYGSSIADYPMCMLTTIDKLSQNLNAQSIILRRNREYEYDFEQVRKLIEIAKAIKSITKDKDLMTRSRVDFKNCEKWLSDDFADLEEIIMEDLRKDPIGAYVKLRRKTRRLKATLPDYPQGEGCYRQFISNVLQPIQDILEDLDIVQSAQGMLSGYDVGDRDIYREIFHPTIRPNFMLTKYMSRPPERGEVIDRYTTPGGIEIEVYDVPGKIRYVYHVTPPEFELDEDNYTVLDAARRYMAAHKPRATEFTEPERMREVFSNIGSDMITDLADHTGTKLSKDKTEELTSILTRYTAGLGILEILLADKNVEDVYINSPVGVKPAFIRHAEYGECETNLIPTQEDAEAWATRFRMTSGRPLDEANPVLDTETEVPGGRARVSIITKTLSPEGLGFALRRHRDKPWTYPLYIHPDINYFNPLFAGLMSFIIDGARTFLVAGTRSSGKCVTGDTLIALPDGKLKPIENIVEDVFEKEGEEEIEDGFISHPSDLEVLSQSNNLNINPKKVSTVWKRKSPEKLIKIKTSTGKVIKTTKEHPYYILDGNVKEKKAEELEEGMRISTPRKLPQKEGGIEDISKSDLNSSKLYIRDIGESLEREIGSEYSNLAEAAEDIGISRGGLRKWLDGGGIPLEKAKELDLQFQMKKLQGKTNSISITMPNTLNQKFAEFLGLLLGDGHIDKRAVNLCNSNKDLREKFLQLGEDLFEINGREEFPKPRSGRAVLQSRTLSRVLNNLFNIPLGKKSRKIKIPKQILASTKQIQKAFLRAYFECDGSTSKRYGEIELGTTSKKMAKHVQLLLLRFGIVSFFKEKDEESKSYRILIRGNEAEKFMDKVGFISQRKKEKFKKARKDVMRTTNLDSLPGCGKILEKLRKGLRVRPKKLREETGKDYWAYENEDYFPTKYWFKKLIDFYEKQFKKRESLREKIENIDIEKSIKLIDELNIGNKELAKVCGISKGTVSNFRNHKYEDSRKKHEIFEGIRKIWQKTVSEDLAETLEHAKELAYSDLFWDKIIEVEEIDSEGEWVYDFSVPENQNFVANGIIAHNTSLLGATMLEIMRKYRIVSVEDSVTGDSRIIIKRNGEIEKTTVGELIDDLIENNPVNDKLSRDLVRQSDLNENISVYSMDGDGKGSFKDVDSFIRHKTNKDIYRVETATGRKLKVTGDHSLFGVGKGEVFEELKVNNLDEGNHIAVPRNYKIGKDEKGSINLLNHLEKLNDFYITGSEIRELIEDKWEKIKEVKKKLGYSDNMPSFWKRKSFLPVKVFRGLNIRIDELNLENIKIKPRRQEQSIPVKISLDDKFLTLVGLWLADGCYDNRSVLFSVVEEELRNVVRNVADNLGLNVKRHSDTFTLILNSKLLKKIMKDIMDLKGNSYTKEIPGWIYNLSKEQISHVLKGIFSGDGCVSDKEIVIPLTSDNLLHDLQTLLLNFNVILRRCNNRSEDGTFNAGISNLKSHKAFEENIGILVKTKREKLEKLCSKVSTNDSSDIIPLNMNTKEELSQVIQNFNTHDYITRRNNIGREHLKGIVSNVPQERINLVNPLKQLAHSDILWDKVVNVEKVEKEEKYVYDFSVPGNENFVCENILAHNTLELPVRQMRNLGFNVERMKSRSVITRVETELPAEEAIRTALRLGDSSLIIGEVRSTEAQALYEAMRVGALANTVAGTIHGDSPYGVFDRVVNDLGVPPTSFKATDFVVVCNTLKRAGGLETYRRVMNITEVRKHWQEDPSQEGGFVDLMKYDAEDDELKPTDTFLNGESKILNEIASNVKEWAGDWGAVWENINLRGNIKKALVDYSIKNNNKELLEAPFVVKSNNKFHLIMSQLREEVGSIPADRAYDMFESWLKDQVKTGKWKEYTV